MPFYPRLGFVFVHVSKTGGRTILEALANEGRELFDRITPETARENGWTDDELAATGTPPRLWMHHLPASAIIKSIGVDVWDSCFSYGMVRNPWDRLLSACAFDLSRQNKGPLTKGLFRSWMNGRFKRISYRPQIGYLCDSYGSPLVNKIGRFENYAHETSQLFDRLGVDVPIGHYNRTKHAHYSTYYDRFTFKRADSVCAQDAERFGYTFK